MFFSVRMLGEQVHLALGLRLLLLRQKLEFAVVVAVVEASFLVVEIVDVAASFADDAVVASSAAENRVVVGVEVADGAFEVDACHREVQADEIADGEGFDDVVEGVD